MQLLMIQHKCSSSNAVIFTYCFLYNFLKGVRRLVFLRVKEILNEQGKSKYWLVKTLGGNYKTISNMIEKETVSISFSTIDKLCNVLHCEPR